MKKAKIMLMTIAVVATVGSALAFKVNKLGDMAYCYAETTVEPTNCEEKTIVNSEAIPGTGYFYTVKTAPSCSTLRCPNQASTFGI